VPRGLEYVDEVDDLEISSAQVTATVYGTHEYRVTLTIGSGQLSGTCTCPQGQEGAFCKHCVATGLTVLEDPASTLNAGGTSARSWLESLSRDELLAELLDLMADEPEVGRRFELRAAAEHADAAVIRRAVRELIEVSDYIEFDRAWSYARDVSKAADAIASLIDTGAAEQAVGIAREAIALLTGAMESVDDSSGMIGDLPPDGAAAGLDPRLLGEARHQRRIRPFPRRAARRPEAQAQPDEDSRRERAVIS
jgi:uncharacterized Zn finger protein